MAYISLYRKWRPQSFSDVIGQSHVTRTLQNALTMGRIGHAYLFSGPRGTGKTTVAKLLAKALNCARGTSAEPCDDCENCRQIKQGVSMDVVEIDGASNRGIDEIRDLREKVRFVPSQGRYKVYIIDEVHMLTTEAFNALLKTLEEPPAHAIFIFATTEPHKVPATIVSRCQSFEFHRISIADLVERINQVAQAEGLTVADGALHLIARNAEGGLRDALSILDQSIAFAGTTISIEDVKALLGVVEFDLVAEFTGALQERNLVQALANIEQVVALGKDLTQFAAALLEYWRDVMVYKAGGGSPEDYTDSEYAQLVAQAAWGTLSQVTAMVATMGETLPEVRRYQSKLPLELAALKIINLQEDSPPVSQAYQEQPSGAGEPPNELPASRPTLRQEPLTKTRPTAKGRSELGEVAEVPAQQTQEEPTTLQDSNQGFGRWSEFLAFLKAKHQLKLQALLRDATPKQQGQNLWIVFRPEMTFHRDNINLAANKAELEEAVAEFYQARWQVQAVCGEVPDLQAKQTPKPDNIQEDPVVQQAINMFGASIVRIEDK